MDPPSEHKYQMQPRVKWVTTETLKRVLARSRADGFTSDLTDEMLDSAGGGCHTIITYDSRNRVVRVYVQLRNVGEEASNVSRVRLEMDMATYDSIPDAEG